MFDNYISIGRNFMIEKNSKKAMTNSVYYQGQIQDMFDFSFISNKADKIRPPFS